MIIFTSKFFSCVIPFVSTPNDGLNAMPVPYYNIKGELQSILEDTPEMSSKKDRMRCFLRNLLVRDSENCRVILNVIFVTCDSRPIDGFNVVQLVQNAGNGLIWKDDSKIFDVRSQRYVSKQKQSCGERIIVYVAKLANDNFNNQADRDELYRLMHENYNQKYDEEAGLKNQFDPDDIIRFKKHGFWEDSRFSSIPALATNYQVWLTMERNWNQHGVKLEKNQPLSC